jgi:gliding motility-associated-like protein
MRSFVKFDLSAFGKLDPTALPNSAKLDLYYYRAALAGDEHLNTGNNAFYIERVTGDWAEDTIRWQVPVSSGFLRMPNVTKMTGNAHRILVPATSTATEDVTIDMTDMVRFWLEYPDSNFGFRVVLADETTERQVHFCSSDYDVPQYRPRLTVDFPKVVANAGRDTIVCQGRGVRLNASGGASYFWTAVTSGADILSKYDIPTPLLKATKAQTYEVAVSIGSCKSTDQVFIDFGVPRPAEISIPSSDTFLCLGDSLQLEARGGTFFKWSPSHILSNDEVVSPWCKPTETVKVYVATISAGEKCPGIDSVVLDIKRQTDGKLTFNDTTVCKGDSVQFKASGGVFYAWEPKDSVNREDIPDPIAFVRADTEFIVEIEDVNSCPDYDTIMVRVVESITVDAGPDLEICQGDTVQLSAAGTGIFQWSNSETLSDAFAPNPKAFPVVTTTYGLKLSGTGCPGLDSLTITVNPKPTISAEKTEYEVCVGTEVTLTATGTTNFWWNTGESSDKIIVKVDEVNTRKVFRVVGNDGKCATDTLDIAVMTKRCGKPYVIVPKFFSPNGDGINDYFVVRDIAKYENELIVINKWGDIIYSTKNYDNRWDGAYSGQLVAEDTYMYVVRVLVNEVWEEERGTVTIIRSKK